MYPVITVPAFNDNYIWLIRHENHCLVVDPGDAEPVLERLAALELQLDAILLTHHHHDHVGGVTALLGHFPHARLYGPKLDPMPAHHGQWLDDGDQINWHGLSLEVIHVPGHTHGHIAYYGHGMLFCGDTLFSAGCGRLFEGTPAQMYASLQRLAALPDDTLIYCAHEYTLSNLRFAYAVEPDNQAIQQRIGLISKLRQQGLPSLPSRLGDEREFNVFLRCEQDSVKFSAEKHALKCLENPEDTFTVLRSWKDVFEQTLIRGPLPLMMRAVFPKDDLSEMKVRTALLAALFLSGCQNLSHQDDRALTAIEPIKSPQVNKKAYKKHSARFLFGDEQIDELDDTDNLWVRISDDMQFDPQENDRVRQQRDWLLRNDKHLATIASRAEPYLYLMVEEIERRELPMELITIPMIESMFDPHARSRSNAVGLWQFVPATGKNFGLRHDNWYDGRRDVLASTNAALDYLEYLNRFFDGDWLQTLAAYNAGEGRVRNAITRNQKAGRPTDYWSLDLPRETRMYVPKILAMADMIRNADKYNVTLPVLANKPQLRVVNTGGQIDLNVAAQLAGLRPAQLKEVNPALTRWSTSPKGPYRLLVPVEYADTLELALADLPQSERIRTRSYQVTSGDTLSRIAQNHGVSVQQLKLANNLSGNHLRRGQTLMIPTSGSKPVVSQSAQNKPQQLASRSAGKIQYKVRAGDNLWSISQAHGVTHDELAKWNGLNAKSALKPGMKLVVWPKQGKSSNKSMVYQVRRGDSLSSIAARFQVAVMDVMRWNQLGKSDYLKPGQELTLFVKNNS